MEPITVHVILNSLSVARTLKDPAEIILRSLDPHRFSTSIYSTSASGEAALFAREALRKKVPMVIVAGGDGTVNEVGSVLVGSETILAIIPIGSGNGLARSLGIPLSIKGSTEIINKMNNRVIDTGEVNGRAFFSVAGAGFDARVASRYSESKKRGLLAYLGIVAREMFRYSSRRYTIEIDGRRLVRKAFLITVSNSGQFGYNTVIAPGAQLDDGLLDVVVIRSISFYKVPRLAYRLMTRKIDQEEETETFKAKKIRIIREKAKRINLDGESVKMAKDLRIKVHPSSLRVIIP